MPGSTGSTILERLILDEAAPVATSPEWVGLSESWHRQVHGAHSLFDDIVEMTEDSELDRALRMLVRWWVRVQMWLVEDAQPGLLTRGGRDRMSIRWFAEWIARRLASSLDAVLRDIFSELIFAQHLRVALARFDGQVQRLRFTLGDEGIIPTAEARGKLGRAQVRMADRLTAFIGLLCDLDVLREAADRPLALGPNAGLVSASLEAGSRSLPAGHET